MNKTRKGYFPLLGFCLLVLAALTGCGTVPKQYVEADRLTLEAVKPYMADTIKGLEGDEKASLEGVMNSWETRVQAAEKATNDD